MIQPASPRRSRFVSLASVTLLAALCAVPATGFAHGNKAGLDIKIRAQNRSVDDTPALCPGVGAGLKGDRLDVDVSTGLDGTAQGKAVLSGADGSTFTLNIDQVFAFFGGLVLMDSATRDTVAIWLGVAEEGGPNFNPVHVNFESPRGCDNTLSTFTVDADKVTTQIQFQ